MTNFPFAGKSSDPSIWDLMLPYLCMNVTFCKEMYLIINTNFYSISIDVVPVALMALCAYLFQFSGFENLAYFVLGELYERG